MIRIDFIIIAVLAIFSLAMFDFDINAVINGAKTGFHLHPFAVVFDAFDTIGRTLDEAGRALPRR